MGILVRLLSFFYFQRRISTDNSSIIGLEFQPAQATLEYHPDPDGGVIRLEFGHEHKPWAVGQHFYLCFPALSIWQSHPMTVMSVPSRGSKSQHHTYVIRCRKGETGRLKQLALNGQVSTPVVICGPYGKALLEEKEESTNLLAVAGGTGVTLTVPVVLGALEKEGMRGAVVDFVWVVRRRGNIRWVGEELREMKRRSKESGIDLNIHIYVTQGEENESGDSTPVENISVVDEKGIDIDPTDEKSEKSIVGALDLDIKLLDHQRPVLKDILGSFLSTRASDQHRTRVLASGPAGMGQDLRRSVASMNSGSAVWRGRKSRDMELYWDSRDG
jgi:NAD(P)H-flavin reductase